MQTSLSVCLITSLSELVIYYFRMNCAFLKFCIHFISEDILYSETYHILGKGSMMEDTSSYYNMRSEFSEDSVLEIYKYFTSKIRLVLEVHEPCFCWQDHICCITLLGFWEVDCREISIVRENLSESFIRCWRLFISYLRILLNFALRRLSIRDNTAYSNHDKLWKR